MVSVGVLVFNVSHEDIYDERDFRGGDIFAGARDGRCESFERRD